MHLIGMLDSPYVRRVAVSLQLLGLRFTHDPLSVFRTFDRFREVNPVVKAPSLVCDDGEVLMDSTLILLHAEALAGRSLLPPAVGARQHALRAIGLALAACEKGIQIVYEHDLRPADKRHAPWLDRVTGQLLAACDAMEGDLQRRPLASSADGLDQAGVTTAVAWTFLQAVVPQQLPPARYPRLAAFTAEVERLPAFRVAPHGPDTVRLAAP